MPKVTTSRSNFSGGEISPLAIGRFDIESYDKSVKIMENFLMNQLGGALYRPGTRYVASTKENGAARLMPFQYDADQDYVMEIGNLYIRLYSNDADLVDITQYTTVQPTAHNDTYVKATSKGSTDFWPYYATDPSKSLTGTRIGNSWMSASGTKQNRFHIDLGSAKTATRIYYENYHNEGGTTNTGAKTFTVWGSNEAGAFAELTYATDTDWTQITAGQTTFDQHTAVDVADPKYIEITNTVPYRYYAIKIADNWGNAEYSGLRRIAFQTTLESTEITTTYVTADIFEIMQAHKNDVKYLTHENYAPAKLSRTSTTAFSLADVNFVRGPFMDTNITTTTISNSASAGNGITLTASTSIFDDAHVGSLWRINAGVVKITAVASATSATADVQVEPDGTAGGIGAPDAYTDWAEGAFSAYRGYPKAVCFHDGRLWYGGTTYEPQKIWGSVKYAYDNFNVDDASDDDACTFEIATEERNEIRWLVSGKNTLTVGTTGGTFSVGGTNGVSIAPDDIQVSRDTNYGVANIPPKKISSFTYYVQRTLNKIRELSFVYDIDSKVANDMTLLAEHILRDGDGVVDLDQQQSPNDRIWCVRDDGQLAVMTRNAEQKVLGWNRIVAGTDSTDVGEFESVAVIPKADSEDQVWVVVKRVIDGTTKRFIEYFTPEVFDEDWDAVRVDCAITVDNPKTITGATSADPVVITSASHGFSNGDQVKINGVKGMTEVNGGIYLVADKADNTFELTDLDGEDIDGSEYATYISGGEVRLMTTAVSGLTHLEGEDVYVQADGVALDDTYTVASGAITLADKAAVVHVGFKYNGTIQLLKLSDGSPTGTGIGKQRRIFLVTFLVNRSLGMKVGKTETTLDEVFFGTANSDTVTDLYSGDLEKHFQTSWRKDDELIIRQDIPSPLNILSIILRSEVSE